MKTAMNQNMTIPAVLRTILSSVVLMTATLAVTSAQAAEPVSKPAGKDASAKSTAQKAYATPEELFQALADAAKASDAKALVTLLGPNGNTLVSSGDAVADKQGRERFAASYADKHSVAKEGDAKAMLIVGNDDWPMPIPAVKGANGWTLDTAAGSHEILARRIGENELSAIQVVRAIVDAEHDFSSEDRDADGLPNYARKFVSSPGKKDGLYWPTKEGESPSPLGPLVVQASSEGYTKGAKGTPQPYHGYLYRMLMAQGKDAKGGALNYIVQGKMIGGFALVAYPAAYGNSGVMSFIVNHDGVVYEKDLGPDTAAVARTIKTYNPDSSWKAAK